MRSAKQRLRCAVYAARVSSMYQPAVRKHAGEKSFTVAGVGKLDITPHPGPSSRMTRRGFDTAALTVLAVALVMQLDILRSVYFPVPARESTTASDVIVATTQFTFNRASEVSRNPQSAQPGVRLTRLGTSCQSRLA
jgi:hypothetical protein